MLLLAVPTALLAAGLFVLSVWFDNAVNRGVTFAGQPGSEPVAWASVPQGGVNTFNLHVEPDPQAITRTLDMARDLGARYVRMQLPWEDVEIHGKGDWSDRRNDLNGDGEPDTIDAWAKYDRIVAAAAERDLDLLLRIDRPPLWARTQAAATPAFQEGLLDDGNSTGPPDDFADYGDFVGAVAARYQGRVRYYQLWNEPNLLAEWNWQQPDPVRFVELLRVGYSAVKRADPQAVVLFPSLSPTDGLHYSAPVSDLDFLDGVYRAGGAPYFDLMSAQLYGLGQPPDEHRYVRWRGLWHRPLDTRTDVGRIVLLREIMELHGDAHKAVWIAEYGWNSAPERIPESVRNPDGSAVSEEQQADFAARRATWGEPVSEEQKGRYIVGLMERARREWPWVGAMDIWMLRYGGYRVADPVDPTPYFALVDRDFNPTTAYAIVRDYLRAPAVAGSGTHAWQHPAVEAIPGGWRLRFEGERLELVGGLEGNMQRVSVDGEPALLSRDATPDGQQRVWLVHPEASRQARPYPFSSGLHTFEVVAPGAEPPVAFVVARQPPMPPWIWTAAPVASLLLLAVALTLGLRALFRVVSRG
jgi:polysaccharide biosynthesis protein PslG